MGTQIREQLLIITNSYVQNCLNYINPDRILVKIEQDKNIEMNQDTSNWRD